MDNYTIKVRVDDYTRLIEFENKIKEGKAYVNRFWGNSWVEEKELIEELEGVIKNLQSQLNELPHSYSRKEIREMSVYEFMKSRAFQRREFKDKLNRCAEKCTD